MNLETIYYIGESVAVLVVIITLFAVIYQLRQVNLLARLETTRTVWLAGAQLLNSYTEDDERSKFLHRALFADEEIADYEKTRLSTFLYSLMVHTESILEMYNNGMMDVMYLDRMEAATGIYLNTRRGRQWWKYARQAAFAPNHEFVAFVDKLIENLEPLDA